MKKMNPNNDTQTTNHDVFMPAMAPAPSEAAATPLPPYVTKEAVSQKLPKPSALFPHFRLMWKLCLTYGISYLCFAYRNTDGIGSGIFAAISALFILVIAKKLGKKSQAATFYLLLAVLISFSNCINDSIFFNFFNHIGSFLLFSVALLKLSFDDTCWDFGAYTNALFCYWFETIGALPIPFKDFSCYRKEQKKPEQPARRYIFIGVLCGLPVLFITTLLLASADQVFSDLLKTIFDFSFLDNRLFEDIATDVFLMPTCFVFYTLLLYLLFGALSKENVSPCLHTGKQHSAVIAITMFVMVDFVYVIFCGIQILYLFLGALAVNGDYASYARKGFFELLFVALINFILVLFCNKHFTKNRGLQIMMTITCICTYIMIVSSAYRMILYVDAYHLTFLRLFVLWFLVVLAFFMAGSLISIYKQEFHTFRYCLFVLSCFYTLLALSSADSRIGTYNVNQFVTEQLDTSGETFQAYLGNYLPDRYKYTTAYADCLLNLREHYGGQLSETNQELITNYLDRETHFKNYSIENGSQTEEDVLKTESAIYDKDRASSIFAWRHYNFLESKCYKNSTD